MIHRWYRLPWCFTRERIVQRDNNEAIEVPLTGLQTSDYYFRIDYQSGFRN